MKLVTCIYLSMKTKKSEESNCKQRQERNKKKGNT